MKKAKENNQVVYKRSFLHNLENGITLIALIITIIIMLILVVVSISVSIQGDLFSKAGEATGKFNDYKEEEGAFTGEKGQTYIDGMVDVYTGNFKEVLTEHKVYYPMSGADFQYYAKASENKVLVLFQSDTDLEFNREEIDAEIFALPTELPDGTLKTAREEAAARGEELGGLYTINAGYTYDYTHVALVDMTGKTIFDGIAEWIESNLTEVADGTNAAMVYDYNANGGTDTVRVLDLNCCNDFYTSSQLRYTPTDYRFLICDVNFNGMIDKADKDSFSYDYAGFSRPAS